MQLANTPLLQSTTPGLHPVSFHQMAPPVRGSKHLITAYYSIYRPKKDQRLSRPWWLVTYRNKVPPPGVEPGHVTHPSTNLARRRVTSLIRPTPTWVRWGDSYDWDEEDDCDKTASYLKYGEYSHQSSADDEQTNDEDAHNAVHAFV